MMQIHQFVMAYRGDHDRIKALLPEGYLSLRPVLRINVEIIGADTPEAYIRVEFNTPVAAKGKRGWLNLNVWESPKTPITTSLENKHLGERTRGTENAAKGMTTVFHLPFLSIEFTGVGIAGGCPAENDNDGCFYISDEKTEFVPAEKITAHQEYCDCVFQWTAPFTEAMGIPVEEILGAYQVEFERNPLQE